MCLSKFVLFFLPDSFPDEFFPVLHYILGYEFFPVLCYILGYEFFPVLRYILGYEFFPVLRYILGYEFSTLILLLGGGHDPSQFYAFLAF